jgi:hypothetical protein
MLDAEASQKEKLEEEIDVLRSQLLQMSMEADEVVVAIIVKDFFFLGGAAISLCNLFLFLT